MKRQFTALAVLAGLLLPAAGQDQPEKKDAPTRPPVLKTTPDELPEGIQRFNGMLVGRLVKKDVEKGTFLVNVDAVPRVWRNSKAEAPKSVIGKNVEVDGVFGKWLDVLLLVKPGETLEFECRHDGGQRLTFPGELLRKAAPFKPEDYPVLPDEFRGFDGVITAKIMKKDPETFELIVQVDEVKSSSEKSRAKQPRSIVGKKMMLAGFWQRKEVYGGLKVGDRIESGVQHIGPQSDHLTVARFVRKLPRSGERETER